MNSLANKVVVIIGGTSGIGLSAAKACIASGAKVVATGVGDSVDSAKKELGTDAVVLDADTTDPGSSDKAISVAIDTFGGFDALYHVAGGSGRRFGDGKLHSATDEGIQKTLELNLTSVLYSNRAALRYFIENKQTGTIVNLTSVLASSPSPEHFGTSVYATAKAGIIGLTKNLAANYASANIRVNAIAAGLVDTPMSSRAQSDATIMDYIKNKQPLDGGRIGTPEDLDALVVYLLSYESRIVTGQVIAVDGGWSVSEGH
ncbi:MAG: SDR family oxidoreductase [Candidatus Hydrogenedentota bacterium]